MSRPSNRQCELARAMTKSTASDEQITRELSDLTLEEWNEQCQKLNKVLKEHSMPFDKGYRIMQQDFINTGVANGVDGATVFIAYMEWKNRMTNNKKKSTCIKNVACVLVYRQFAKVVQAEFVYRAFPEPDNITPIENLVTVVESIESLENSLFSDSVKWTYENTSHTSATEDFILCGDVNDTTVGTIVVIHLKVRNGYTLEEVESELSKKHTDVFHRRSHEQV